MARLPDARLLNTAARREDADKLVADATIAVTLSPDRGPAYTKPPALWAICALHDYQQSIADGNAALKESPTPDPKTYLHLARPTPTWANSISLGRFRQFVKLQPREPTATGGAPASSSRRKNPIKMLAEMKKVTELDSGGGARRTAGVGSPTQR